MTKIDPRTLKTKAKIEAAMFQLCKDNVAFDSLTVPKLASVAGISRQTFYRYYLSPKQVVTALIDRHLDEFHQDFRLQTLTARNMTQQLMTVWQERTAVFELVEWANARIEFIQRLAEFNHLIAEQNKVNLIDEDTVCHVYAAATYMFLRDYVLKKKWTQAHATDLLLHLTNNMDEIF